MEELAVLPPNRTFVMRTTPMPSTLSLRTSNDATPLHLRMEMQLDETSSDDGDYEDPEPERNKWCQSSISRNIKIVMGVTLIMLTMLMLLVTFVHQNVSRSGSRHLFVTGDINPRSMYKIGTTFAPNRSKKNPFYPSMNENSEINLSPSPYSYQSLITEESTVNTDLSVTSMEPSTFYDFNSLEENLESATSEPKVDYIDGQRSGSILQGIVF